MLLGRTTLDHRWYPSPNFGERKPIATLSASMPDMLIIHYTAMDDPARAREWLCNPQSRVSSHYLVDRHGQITQMVDERARAWHAGEAIWQDEPDVNSRSIGIEICHPGPGESCCPDYTDAQMTSVIALSQDICTRHDIERRNVIGHSDIAPHRKQDPGERFDWQRLAQAGVGYWDDAVCRRFTSDCPENMFMPAALCALAEKAPAQKDLKSLQHDLASIGYGVRLDGIWDDRVAQVVIAFQRHWMQDRVDGQVDSEVEQCARRLSEALAATDTAKQEK